MIQQAIDLALGRAFTPDPIDTSVPLALRFAKRPLLAVTIYKDGLEAVPITFQAGAPSFGQAAYAATGGEDVDANFLGTLAERLKARDCLINLATGYTAVLSSRAARPESDEEAILLMRDNPERILGEPPAQGCRHSVAFHPTHNFAVVFAHRESEINLAISLAAKAELSVARLQCGMSSLLMSILGNHWTAVGQEAEVLFVDRGSVFTLPVGQGSLGRPLFDIGLKEGPLKQAIAERVAKLRAGGKVVLVNPGGIDVEAMIRERNAEISVATPFKDVPHPALAACCADKPRLGYDLFPNERPVRPFAPKSLKAVPVLLWASAAAFVLVGGGNEVRKVQSSRMAASYAHQAEVIEGIEARTKAVIEQTESRQKAAASICDWLLISPGTEALLVDLTREIAGATDQGMKEGKPVARVDSLSITRQEGQPQMRLVLVVAGDASAANRIFQRISAYFGRKGYNTIDLKESLVPQGYRYEHLLNIPRTVGS